MHEKPATEILTRIMNWSHDDVTDNLADLQALSSYGYDEYQQFRPGMRFVESLASWLNQLPQEKRAVAFRFVKDKILYMTQDQIKQIISVTYEEYVVPILLRQVSNEFTPATPYWRVAQLLDSDEFTILLHKCLFVGLSDGSQVDVFRRTNSKIDHEQIYRTHEINRTRKVKIKEALRKSLPDREQETYFRNIFLLDDFSGSGITYITEDMSSACGMDGKIVNFYKSIMDSQDPASELVNTEDLRVWLILYMATERAKERLQSMGSQLFKNIPFSVIVNHTIPDSVKYMENDDAEFTDLIKDREFGWDGLDTDEHMNKSNNNEKPYLGFDACALPLILNHNTPNNSLPILHRNEDNIKFKGLFPRISRHQ